LVRAGTFSSIKKVTCMLDIQEPKSSEHCSKSHPTASRITQCKGLRAATKAQKTVARFRFWQYTCKSMKLKETTARQRLC
jgi:hypothetical protein